MEVVQENSTDESVHQSVFFLPSSPPVASLSPFDFPTCPRFFRCRACLSRDRPLTASTQLCATVVCHRWIVVLVTTENTFHNGLEQSLWKQSFWFAINNLPAGAYVHIVEYKKKISLCSSDTEKKVARKHSSLKTCSCCWHCPRCEEELQPQITLSGHRILS